MTFAYMGRVCKTSLLVLLKPSLRGGECMVGNRPTSGHTGPPRDQRDVGANTAAMCTPLEATSEQARHERSSALYTGQIRGLGGGIRGYRGTSLIKNGGLQGYLASQKNRPPTEGLCLGSKGGSGSSDPHPALQAWWYALGTTGVPH